MIVAVTGGTGFIGARLVLQHLMRGDTVRVLSRSAVPKPGLPAEVSLYKGDLANEDTDLRSFVRSADVLYHCAGEIIDSTRMHALHVAGTQRLIDAASNKIGHWVQLSSTGAYGQIYAGIVTEETPLKPANTYEMTKTKSDELVLAAAERGAFTCTIFRPSNVFGTTMPNQSLFQMIDMIYRGLFFFIGKPGASANYIHVDNVAEGLMRCGTIPAAKGRTYILSDQRTIEEFVGVIAEAQGKPLPKLRLPEKPVRLAARYFGKLSCFPLTESRVNALVSRVVYSTRRIQQELGYFHTVSMEDGLRELTQAWRQRT